MTKEEKRELVQKLEEKLKAKPNVYVTETGGLTVEEVNNLRQLCHNAGVEMQVVKNTLLKKALDSAEGDYSELYDRLKLQSAVFFVDETAVNAPAKVIKEFRKSNKKPIIKGAYVGASVYLGDESLETLVNLKSKEELIGDIIGLLQSPAKNVISALSSGGGTLHGLLKAIGERNG